MPSYALNCGMRIVLLLHSLAATCYVAGSVVCCAHIWKLKPCPATPESVVPLLPVARITGRVVLTANPHSPMFPSRAKGCVKSLQNS